MRAPEFWHHGGFWAEFFLPFSVPYYLYMRLRQGLATSRTLAVPVICVGNATVGGSGKTPVAIALAALLKKRKIKVAFVSKGYGGTVRHPTKVDPAIHTSRDVGDEPLLLAKIAPCWVGSDRYETGKKAIADGASCLILDDGLQDMTLTKTLSFLVVDGAYGFGNHYLLPAGPLRERLDHALERCAAGIIIGKDTAGIRKKLSQKPILTARLSPTKKIDKKAAYFAFAGIGHPEKFYKTLEAMGLKIAGFKDFPDHHPYTESDLKMLLEAAQSAGAQLITTEKDAARLSSPWYKNIVTVPVELRWDKPEAITRLLESIL